MTNISETSSIAIDAEWEESKRGCRYLTAQIAVSNPIGEIKQYFLFINPEFVDINSISIDSYKGVPVEVIPWELGKVGVIDYFQELPKVIDIYMFHSPVDCECLLGKDNWSFLLDKGFVKKKRNLYVNWDKKNLHKLNLSETVLKSKLNFIDVYGRVGCSLEEAYETLNIDTSQGKDYIKDFNIDKSKISLFLKEHPVEFFQYGLGDLELHKLCLNLHSYMSEIVEECFGLKDLFSSLREYPGTIGSLVNQIFIAFVEKEYPEILHKLSYVSTTANSKIRSKVSKILKCGEKDEAIKTKEVLSLKGVIHGLGGGSIPAFFPGNYDQNGRSPFGAVVHGGRTVKECKSGETTFTDVFDIDLKSAYGSSLCNFDYPLGLPTCISLSNANSSNSNSKPDFTLKKVLSKYKNQLVDGLYVIYVSGNIPKNQDLIISKYGLTTNNIGVRILSSTYEDNDDTFKGRLGGEVILTTKEIHLGVITSDTLKVLKSVSNNVEWKNFLDLEVELLVFYPKNKELSPTDWLEKHSDLKSLNSNRFANKDKRTKYWCRFKLSQFLDPLLQKRLEFKKLARSDKTYDTKQKLLKLLINTVYGDLASPYFQMGNTIVANNITSQVRTAAWMMAKALGNKITVTDGGFYEFKRVNALKTHTKNFRKPGIAGLFDIEKHYSTYQKSLIDNFDPLTTTPEEIDELALKHIKDFWSVYGLEFPNPIEHKFENCSSLAILSHYTKVDYLFETYCGELIWKIRGVKPSEIDSHPKAEVLRAIKEKRSVKFQVADLSKVLGVNEYVKAVSKDVLPGHTVEVLFVYRPNKNGGDLFETYKDYQKAVHAHKMRISRFEKRYIDVEIRVRPIFKG